MVTKVLILDGYTDEPAGFGVPPYIDVYPRYIAGAIWSYDKSISIIYLTVDEVRKDVNKFISVANEFDIVIVIAGALVPGKYLGGTPITIDELKTWFRLIEKPFKILTGPAARYGVGNIGGGRVKALPKDISENFDAIVTGDPDLYVYTMLKHGVERAEEWRTWDKLDELNRFAIIGAKIVEQHPNFGYNLVAEIETYKGCTRWVVGGCSFCITKSLGPPKQRPTMAIVKEVEALYSVGVRHFRIGRQADILVYGSKELGQEEWPKPNPRELERLFHGIRAVAPSLYTLHIDNVNPGTIAHHVELAREALKIIIKYHTPGDVAALGIETADPVVVEKNNLKVYPDEALTAIRVINEVGGERGYNGLPELLPGINFVLGLIGETATTYKLNLEFIKQVYDEGLLLRRINVRQVLILPGTLMWTHGDKEIKKHKSLARRFREQVMKYSKLFLQRLVPRGTILKDLYIEFYDPRIGVTYARQAGSYPLVVEIPCRIEPPGVVDAVVYGYAGRSVRGLPIPLDANRVPYAIAAKLLGDTLAARLVGGRPYTSRSQIEQTIGEYAAYFDVKGYTCQH